jgi:hypothetical protein
MPSPLDALAQLSLNATDPHGLIAARQKREDAVLEMQRSLEHQAADPTHTFSGATNADVANDTADLEASPNFGKAAQAHDLAVTNENAAMEDYNRPDVTKKRNDLAAQKLAELTVPNVEAAKVSGANALALENAKAANERAAMEQTNKSNLSTLDLLRGGGAGAGGGSNGITMRPNFNAKGQMTLSGVPTPPAVLAQEHGAQVGLSEIPKLRAIIDTLDKSGSIGPVAGRLGTAATATGLDALLMSPESSRAFSDFKNQASLVKSNMAMVHGGARGGSNQAMAERFDKLINTAQTPAAMKGALDAFERWLTQYAGAKSSAELDAADAELGIPSLHNGTAAPGSDLGADWGK